MNILKEAFEKSAQTDNGIQEALQEVKLLNISKEDVFDATRRAYSDKFGELSNDEIVSFFALHTEDELAKHVYNIKGYLLEQEVEQQLIEAGFQVSLHEVINHPESDIIVEIEDNTIEYQIKMTSDEGYINSTLDKTPEIGIITTADIDNSGQEEMILKTAVEDEAIEEFVSDAISPVPISITGLLIRSAFAAFGFGFF